MNESSKHLSSEILQAYLEEALSGERLDQAESHLSECARCASELEGWQLLFSDLGGISELAPPEGFADRVMAQVPVRRPLLSRVSDRIRSVVGSGLAGADGHLQPDRIQELLDGALGTGGRRRVERHLAACGRCRTEVREWEPLFQSLESLPRLEPSPGFADRTMAAFQASRVGAVEEVPAAEPASVSDRVWAAMEAGLDRGLGLVRTAPRLLPATRRGWAFLLGAISLPAVGVLAMVSTVLFHPLVTLEGLAVFLRWRVAEQMQLVMGWMAERIVDSPVLLWLWEGAAALVAAPGLAVSVLLALWAATLVSGWVLYRNVIAPPSLEGRHAQV